MIPIILVLAIPVVGSALRFALRSESAASSARAERVQEQCARQAMVVDWQARAAESRAEATQRAEVKAAARQLLDAFIRDLDLSDDLAEEADNADRVEDVIHFAVGRRKRIRQHLRRNP